MTWITYTPSLPLRKMGEPTAVVRNGTISLTQAAVEVLGLQLGKRYSVQIESETKSLRFIPQPDDVTGIYAPKLSKANTGGNRMGCPGLHLQIGTQPRHNYLAVPAAGAVPAYLKRMVPVAKAEAVHPKAGMSLSARLAGARAQVMERLSKGGLIDTPYQDALAYEWMLGEGQVTTLCVNCAKAHREVTG